MCSYEFLTQSGKHAASQRHATDFYFHGIWATILLFVAFSTVFTIGCFKTSSFSSRRHSRHRQNRVEKGPKVEKSMRVSLHCTPNTNASEYITPSTLPKNTIKTALTVNSTNMKPAYPWKAPTLPPANNLPVIFVETSTQQPVDTTHLLSEKTPKSGDDVQVRNQAAFDPTLATTNVQQPENVVKSTRNLSQLKAAEQSMPPTSVREQVTNGNQNKALLTEFMPKDEGKEYRMNGQ